MGEIDYKDLGSLEKRSHRLVMRTFIGLKTFRSSLIVVELNRATHLQVDYGTKKVQRGCLDVQTTSYTSSRVDFTNLVS